MNFPRYHHLTPPRTHLSSELALVLAVTFGRGGVSADIATGSQEARRWACDLGIGERFSERLAQRRSAGEFGSQDSPNVAPPPSRRSATQPSLELLSRVLAGLSVDGVLLDDSVLPRHNRRADAARTWARPLLIRGDDHARVFPALLEAGCVRVAGEFGPHLDAVLSVPGRISAEDHRTDTGELLLLQRELRFVRMVPGGNFMDLACLKRCGLLVPIAVNGGCGLWRPADCVRTAYAVAQALVDHRFNPEFSFFSALAACSELGLGHDDDLAFDAYLLLQTDVEHAEFEAWRELIRGLTGQNLSELGVRARTLLDHALAAARSPTYRLKLAAQRRVQRWQQAGRLERIADALDWVITRMRRKG